MANIITYNFCEPFLDHLADFIDENYIQKGWDLSRLAVVFGGRRPSLFLKRDLAKRIKQSFYPPQFFTIDEFVSFLLNKHQPFSTAQDLDNCFLLYTLARKAVPEILKNRETFAQFLPWTREISSFIDQLDLENVDDQVLLNIQANAQIGYPVPEDINRLLKNIVTLRQAYHQKLIERRVYSRGFQYLLAAQAIKEIDFKEFDQILFCNFFYFHRTEEAIIKNLYQRNMATLIFQGDQRRWPVLKRIAETFSCSLQEAEEPQAPKFDLKLYAGFDAHSQVCLAREILKKIKNLDNTVIVLPNPDQMIPLISEIAEIAGEFNISMGYPLKRSSLFSLFEFVFKAQLSMKEGRYYAKDYLKVLRHPFIKNLRFTADPTTPRILIHKIEEILTGKERTLLSGQLFLNLEDIVCLDDLYQVTTEMLERLGIYTSRKDLEALLRQIHELAFLQWENVENFSSFASLLGKFLDVLIQKSFMGQYPLNLNIAERMYSNKDEFQNTSFGKEDFPKEEIFKIFTSKVEREMVAFMGSPLKGLQVLGLLETRSLNFENVIILDVNEGTLPKLNIYEPLIPREVMISLNLDRLELEEEIQRYQFMRLISSAQNVHLIYQESKDKEKSRFVEELIWEEQKKKKDLQAIAVRRAGFQVKVASQERVIKKTPQIVEFLKNFTYSASSINTYLKDPLEFYQNYVLGLREQEDLLDEPEARHVGTFIHELLEDSFQPFLNKKPEINSSFRNRFSKIFDQKFEETFGRSMKSDSFLLKSVIKERLNRFLDNEQFNEEREVEKILHLESRFEDTIPLSRGEVKFKYIVDRIDQLKDGTIMIIDYKTGSIDQMPKDVERIKSITWSRELIKENIKSFQIPLYFYYLDKQFKGQPINAALYNLRTLELHKFVDQKKFSNRKQINEIFLRALDFIITEILNPDINFVSDHMVGRYQKLF